MAYRRVGSHKLNLESSRSTYLFLKFITLTLTPVGPSEPQIISRGMAHRRVGSHELNLESSRSHSIMTVHVESSPSDAQVGNLHT